MNANLDEDRLRRALQAEDELALKQFDPTANESMFGQMFDLLRGKARWWTVLIGFFAFAFFAAAVYSVFRFFDAGETKYQIMWATAFLTGMMANGMLKMWMWMQMNKNAVKRELKRLELQVAHLSEKVTN